MSQLLDTLSHMPFQTSEGLYFCRSGGLMEFTVPQTEFDKKLKRPEQVVTYQPWSLAVLRGGEVTPLVIPNLAIESPVTVFCNPVVSPDCLSFIHGRTLWTVNLKNHDFTALAVKSQVFTGFSNATNLVYAIPACLGAKGRFVRNEEIFESGLDHLLRIIPHGDGSLILTGKRDGEFISLLWESPNSIYRITANGENVYKCCLDGDFVIHAKREVDFEERYLHKDLASFVSYTP